MPRTSNRSDGAAYTNVQRLNDDLLIAQRTDQRKGTWYLHKLGRKWVRRSLNTDDMKLARSRAYEAYRVWQDDPHGDWLAAIGSTRHHLGFKAVAEEWLTTQAKDRAYKADVIRKFLVPFFHGVRSVTDMGAIDDVMIGEYRHWRLNFWQSPSVGEPTGPPASIKSAAKQTIHFGRPSATTLNREGPTLRQILAYAERKGCFRGRAVPQVPTEASKPNPRPAFLGGDFDKLASEAAKWVDEADTDECRWRRQLLADWIWVARFTGIRLPHEAAKLTWGDVRLDTKLIHIAEDTKTGRRDVPLNEKAADRLQQMRDRRLNYAKESRQKFSERERVFVLQNGRAFKDLGKLFNQLVERCAFPARSDGGTYSPYSLRHTFATFALADDMSGDRVAETMGTSVKMLNSHYKHGTIEQTRRYLVENGLIATGRKLVPREDWEPLEVTMLEDLPPGDWRRKKLIIAPE
jgi:integrase